MWPRNALTERLNLRWPIFQAPMGSMSTPALAASVSTSGGLGGLGMWGLSADAAERRIAGFRQQSGGGLNVNYPLWPAPEPALDAGDAMRRNLQPWYDAQGLGVAPEPRAGRTGEVSDDHLSMLLRARPEVVSFHFGLPEPKIMQALKGAGLFVISSATTVAEAKLLEAGGVDAVIAQGIEAGGHRGTFTDVDIGAQPGLFALLPQVVDAVAVPVIAAGGVADGRTAAAAFVLGASAVQLGTAFLRCEEANVADAYRQVLAHADDASTVVTDVISGRPARLVTNRLIDDLVSSGLKPLAFPAQLGVTAPLGGSGSPETLAVFAGQSAALTRDMTAAELVAALASETSRRLEAFSRPRE